MSDALFSLTMFGLYSESLPVSNDLFLNNFTSLHGLGVGIFFIHILLVIMQTVLIPGSRL